MANQSFNEIIYSDQPVLVDFYATWCGPCKAMAPMLEEVAKKVGNKAKIIKVDVDKNPEAANNYRVQGVPTLILFQNGQIKWRQSGVVQTNQLLDVINRYSY